MNDILSRWSALNITIQLDLFTVELSLKQSTNLKSTSIFGKICVMSYHLLSLVLTYHMCQKINNQMVEINSFWASYYDVSSIMI